MINVGAYSDTLGLRDYPHILRHLVHFSLFSILHISLMAHHSSMSDLQIYFCTWNFTENFKQKTGEEIDAHKKALQTISFYSKNLLKPVQKCQKLKTKNI